jgi:hypothetical protein
MKQLYANPDDIEATEEAGRGISKKVNEEQ